MRVHQQPPIRFSGRQDGNGSNKNLGNRFRQLRDNFSRKTGETREFRKTKPRFLQNGFFKGIANGLKRVVTKSLRLRGLAELALIPLGGVGLIFPIKHFIEGFTGYNSIFFRRAIPRMLAFRKDFNGRGTIDRRSMVQGWKDFRADKKAWKEAKKLQTQAAEKTG